MLVRSVLLPEQRNALTLTLLNVHQHGISVVGIFWGLWLFPFGLLVIKSGFIPMFLGALLIVGCLPCKMTILPSAIQLRA